MPKVKQKSGKAGRPARNSEMSDSDDDIHETAPDNNHTRDTDPELQQMLATSLASTQACLQVIANQVAPVNATPATTMPQCAASTSRQDVPEVIKQTGTPPDEPDYTTMEDYEIVCYCGNDTFKDYYYKGTFYGKVCLKCWKELLTSGMMSWEHSRPPTPRLFSRQVSLPEFKRAFPVSPARREIKEEEMIFLMPGDHIMWRRPYVMWHHAIVIRSVDPSASQAANPLSEVFVNGMPDGSNDGMLKVLHWSKTRNGIEVNEKSIVYSEELGTMYLACYDEKVIRNNPPGLVLARAYALAGSTDYQFFKRNCENYAVFCKTGVNFNHQFPWLMLKLDETATSTLLGQIQMVSLIPIYINGIECSGNLHQALFGIGMTAVLLEFVSLVNDWGNMYFEYMYPASCYKVNRKDYNTSLIMRLFEFVFGASGMVGGAITCEQLSICIAKEIGPGLGELLGLELAMLFGTIVGFLLGTLGKVLGNAFGICVARRSTCCYISNTAEAELDHEPMVPGTPGAESNCQMLLNDDNLYNQVEDDDQTRKMRKIYRPSCWVAQLGLAVMIFNFSLLTVVTLQYIKVHWDFRNSVQSYCITTFQNNETFSCYPYAPCAPCAPCIPCVKILVDVYDSPFNTTDHDIFLIGNNSQLFEDENTFDKGTCSYYPYFIENCTIANEMVDEYVNKYGKNDANFSCYHQFNDPSKVVRVYTSVITVVYILLILLPTTLLMCIGIFLVFYSVAKHRRDENCFSTLVIVLGLRSYFDLLERCKCCLHNSA